MIAAARADLTPAEVAALAAYARHGSIRAAAEASFISPLTLRKHLNNAYSKLGVHRSVQAFRVLGWLRTPEERQEPGGLHRLRCTNDPCDCEEVILVG